MTVSVMVWRAIFSVWTLMAGSFFRNAKNMVNASTTTTMAEITMNFPRPLRLGLGASVGDFKIGGDSTLRSLPKDAWLVQNGNCLGKKNGWRGRIYQLTDSDTATNN